MSCECKWTAPRHSLCWPSGRKSSPKGRRRSRGSEKTWQPWAHHWAFESSEGVEHEDTASVLVKGEGRTKGRFKATIKKEKTANRADSMCMVAYPMRISAKYSIAFSRYYRLSRITPASASLLFPTQLGRDHRHGIPGHSLSRER